MKRTRILTGLSRKEKKLRRRETENSVPCTEVDGIMQRFVNVKEAVRTMTSAENVMKPLAPAMPATPPPYSDFLLHMPLTSLRS